MEEHYSSDEGEVFIGALANSEISKRRQLHGDNYNSPVTPRPPRLNQVSTGIQESQANVLNSANTSTPVHRQQSVGNRQDQSTHVPFDDSSDETDDVIVLDASRNSNSVITLSDDESFVRHEASCSEQFPTVDNGNRTILKDLTSNNEITNVNETAGASELQYSSILSEKEFVIASDMTKDQRLHESSENISESGEYILNNSGSINHSEAEYPRTAADKSYESKSDMEKSSCSLVQDIDDFVGDSNADVASAAVGQTTDAHGIAMLSNQSPIGKNLGTSGLMKPNTFQSEETYDMKLNTSNTKQVTNFTAAKHSFNISGLSNIEFSLNNITDSILNISHGSSLPSPPDTHRSQNPPNLYEDISCDGDQLDIIADTSNVEQNNYHEDLHMSVDFQQQGFSDNFVTSYSLGGSVVISQPFENKSCPSAQSSYTTAYDTTKPDSFQNYRDASIDLEECNDIESVSIKSDEENVNEASFEMVIQNRQNSFNGTPTKTTEGVKKDEKSQVMSRLPVYNGSKGFLRPPKFCVNPDTLKTSSYKFAKQISKLGTEKPGVHKLPGPLNSNKYVKSPLVEKQETTKTPVKINTPKQNMPTHKMQTSSLTKSKIPSQSYLPVKASSQNILSKTPVINTPKRTPTLKISGIPRAVKSDSKVARVLTPLNNHNSGGKSVGKMGSVKDKYKNIISPIQAYIKGSTPISQRKAQVTIEEQENRESDVYKTTKLTKTVPKALQKLKYDNVQGQENVNPNSINPSRDTLPCKILEPTLQVFWREQDQTVESRLPKMGEKLTKMLSGPPKPKLTVHEGRVHQSPQSKGVLVQDMSSVPTSADELNVDNLPEKMDGRISVRIQRDIELP